MKKIISLLILVSLVLTMAGCGEKSSKQVTKEYLDSLKIEAKTSIENVEDANDIFSCDENLQKEFYTMLSDFEYELGEEKIENNSATVTATIKTYDFGTMITDFLKDYLTQAFTLAFSGATEEEMNKVTAQILEDKITKTKEEGKITNAEIKISLNKTDDGWVVNEETGKAIIGSAILGGMYEVLSQFSE